jgi:acyl-CoA thioesterase
MHDALTPERAQAVANAVGASMFERDRASQAMGMVLAEIRPGYARMTMPVRDDMLNGHHTCHGGFIFALADSAFAFACNSHNHVTVGAGCTIEYLAPGRPGDVLAAEAQEQAQAGRPGSAMYGFITRTASWLRCSGASRIASAATLYRNVYRNNRR